MIGPSIEPSEVGFTGLVWLFLSYGYVLYFASNLISEGSELLLLVPHLAGLVGGVVLPLLGAVPDGAIILFSGLGSLETAQETLSVGVGALAGSTIMLLTVPFGLSIYGGRVDLTGESQDRPNYRGKPKLTPNLPLSTELTQTGVAITEAVQHGAVSMMLTTIPYFLIQIPAILDPTATRQQVVGEQHYWALAGFVICAAGLVAYMRLQLKMSQAGQDRGKRMAVMKRKLHQGRISLSGAVASQLRQTEQEQQQASSEYQSLSTADSAPRYPPPAAAEYLKEILADAFRTYDKDSNGLLDRHETHIFFRDFHESISDAETAQLFAKYDTDQSGFISLDEFIGLAYALIKLQDSTAKHTGDSHSALAETAFSEVDDEEEEVPDEFTDLPPDQQQTAIQKRAFGMLLTGTALVVLFSDPMVDVMQEIAVRAHLSPFYVSFVLAPLASNASEVLSSQYYASKKTSKTITVSLSALTGAASMNNTFCLSIFMGLIFVRGLAWQYTAETVAIIAVEFVVGLLLWGGKYMTLGRAVAVGLIFPLSIALVAILEALGFD